LPVIAANPACRQAGLPADRRKPNIKGEKDAKKNTIKNDKVQKRP
jgi:hypothetical protein